MSDKKVKALDSGYIGKASGGYDQITKGQEYDAEDPMVKNHPVLFTAPYVVQQPPTPPSRGRRG